MPPNMLCFQLLLLLCSLLGVSGCGPADASSEPALPRPVITSQVNRATDVEQRTISGTVRARDRALLSFEVSGRVAEVRFDVGEAFDKGAVLARLDRQVPQLNVSHSRAQVREAEASVSQAKLDFEREKALLDRNATTQAAFDRASAQLATAESRLSMARASAALALEALSDTVLHAPYAGVVAERLVEPSQNIAAGTPALRIQGSEQLEVVIEVPETLVSNLQGGSEHQVRILALDLPSLTGTITEIGADALPGGTYPVHLALTSPPEGLRSGASAEVTLGLSRGADTPVIPLTAFLPTEKQNMCQVFVLEPAKDTEEDAMPIYTARRRTVHIAQLTTNHAVVAEGLSDGELIVTRGLSMLRDGQQVTRLDDIPDRYGH